MVGLTHGFYRYPARFSPQFARSAIEAFTEPLDTVLDPFMGGGTSAVEALGLGASVCRKRYQRAWAVCDAHQDYAVVRARRRRFDGMGIRPRGKWQRSGLGGPQGHLVSLPGQHTLVDSQGNRHGAGKSVLSQQSTPSGFRQVGSSQNCSMGAGLQGQSSFEQRIPHNANFQHGANAGVRAQLP